LDDDPEVKADVQKADRTDRFELCSK
jgi:hypothetical protein